MTKLFVSQRISQLSQWRNVKMKWSLCVDTLRIALYSLHLNEHMNYFLLKKLFLRLCVVNVFLHPPLHSISLRQWKVFEPLVQIISIWIIAASTKQPKSFHSFCDSWPGWHSFKPVKYGSNNSFCVSAANESLPVTHLRYMRQYLTLANSMYSWIHRNSNGYCSKM